MTIQVNKLVPMYYLQQYCVDKDTGLPLAAGIITFYKDQARTIPKPVYILSGTPPTYTVTQLNDVNGKITLSSVGTIQDGSGNDVVAYFYPYDDNGNPELYYITCDSAGLIRQWTREGEPTIGASSIVTTSQIENFITNGQFFVHRNLTDINGLVPAVTSINLLGNWYYSRSGTLPTDYIIFQRFNTIVTSPIGNPRYAINIKCTSPHAGDTSKRLYYMFDDVNKFASSNELYTFFFTAKCNVGTSQQISFYLYKNYGTGGGGEEYVHIQDFTITNTWQNYQTPSGFLWGSNIGKSIGNSNDDHCALVISLPPDIVFDLSFTNFIMTSDVVTINAFPVDPTNETLSKSLWSWVNIDIDYIRNYIGLPLILGQYGIGFNTADIGKIYACMYSAPQFGELECNGSSYDVSAFSSDGIPYSRLHSKLYNAVTNLPMFPSPNFITGRNVTSLTDNFTVATNIEGIVTTITDGAIPTGFTFNNINSPTAGFNFNAWVNPIDGKVYISNNIVGLPLSPPAAGSGAFTVSVFTTGDTNIAEVTTVLINTTTLAGEGFSISNTTTDYYVWYKVDGVGVDPALGGTGIEVDILSTHTLSNISQITADAIAGHYIANILTIAASSIPAGSYFTYHTTTEDGYVWYSIDGVGTDPSLISNRGIEVALLSTDTAAQVGYKTMYQINNTVFAVPDLRGWFLRGWSHGSGNDPEAASRFSVNGSPSADNVGSGQYSSYLNHTHFLTFAGNYVAINDSVAGGSQFATGGAHAEQSISATVGNSPTGNPYESRPINRYVMYVIKY